MKTLLKLKQTTRLAVCLSLLLAAFSSTAAPVVAPVIVPSPRTVDRGGSEKAVAATGYVVCVQPANTKCRVHRLFDGYTDYSFQDYVKFETGISNVEIVAISFNDYSGKLVIYFRHGS